LVLYAVGGRKRVFALAQVTSEVYESREDRWPYRVNVSYTVNLAPSSGVPIHEINTPERDLLKSIARRSYIKLMPEEYELVETKLRSVNGRH
jgi:hypothetical protein